MIRPEDQKQVIETIRVGVNILKLGDGTNEPTVEQLREKVCNLETVETLLGEIHYLEVRIKELDASA